MLRSYVLVWDHFTEIESGEKQLSDVLYKGRPASPEYVREPFKNVLAEFVR